MKITPIDFSKNDAMHIDTFNEYHGTNFKGWDGLHKEMGYDWSKPNDFQELYLIWLEVHNTPLMDALRENE